MTTAEAAYEAYRMAMGLSGSFFSLSSAERDAWEDVVETVHEEDGWDEEKRHD